jgi:voltage-gated potassium channel
MLSRGHEELAPNVTNQGLSLRARLYAILRQADVSAGARQWRKFDLTVIVIGLLTVALATVDDLPPLTHRILIAVIMLLSALFFLEYLVRLWVAPEALSETARSPAGARLRWALSIKGLIGLLAVIPAVFIATGAAVAGTDAVNVFGLMWILKLGLHAPAMGTLARVVSNERDTLASILIIFLIVLVAAATGTLLFEHKVQADRFGGLPDALWWAIVTLTTVGYGDVVPATVGGKIIGAVVMVSGIAVLALMTGVLASGFAEEERRREYIRVWEQVLRVPMFTVLGVATLSEIVSKLRTRHYPAHIAVVRRGDPGDSMFFISNGEVEVRLPHRAVKIEQGGFFGEMALLDRGPRNATVITTKPTALLVLFASDFYQIASKIPSLAEAIEIEARRRQAENQERGAQRGNPPSAAS